MKEAVRELAIANEIGQQINSERPHKDLELVRMALDWPVKNLVKVSLCRSLIKNKKTHEGSTSGRIRQKELIRREIRCGWTFPC